MNTYDQPTVISYELNAASLASAAELRTLVGPAGKTGRVTSISALVTTGVTGAPATVSVNTLNDAIQAGSLEVPVGAADTFANASVNGTDDTLIPADTAFTIDCDGGATAGAANLVVAIAWF